MRFIHDRQSRGEPYGRNATRWLAEVKAKYDPENVFHNNKNIRPG